MSDEFRDRRFLNSRALSERYAIAVRTVDRWVAAGILPEPVSINGLRYWSLGEIEERERQRMAPRTARGA
jgi:predicted DNA-binding transcriptional regulator AlpA